MARITYKSLFELVKDEIGKSTTYNTKKAPAAHLARSGGSATLVGSALSDISAAQLITAVQNLLSNTIPSHIDEGLTVEAKDPISRYVTIKAGKGSAGGFYYELEGDVDLLIPFDSTTSIFYINLYKDRVMVDRTLDSKKLTLAKIIIPEPGVTNRVRDSRDNSFDAYIINFTEYKLFGDAYGFFEEDTIDILRKNIGDILADNLIGDILLSESLRVVNVQGSIELDGTGLRVNNQDGTTLSQFDKDGIHIYNERNVEVAKFTRNEARIGNIQITENSIQSENFVENSRGFRIKDNGDVEFNDLIVRGTIYATAGTIGGWTIAEDKIYANPDGRIQTGANVGAGQNGVVLDGLGLRVYDDVLGLVANFPSDGSVPTISSGIIREVTFEISTNSILRTSETVGDGSANSYGILINNTGLYGCGPNQYLSDANLKVLANGDIYLRGEIFANSGVIGGVTIENDRLVGGTIIGATLIGTVIETSESLPRIRIDASGLYYEITGAVGKYSQFKYGDGTLYGAGILAKIFDTNFPVVAILAEQDLADIRLYNRSNDPVTGDHELGDLLCANGIIKRCKTAGSPGTFDALLSSSEVTGYDSAFIPGGDYVEVNINGTTYKMLYIP